MQPPQNPDPPAVYPPLLTAQRYNNLGRGCSHVGFGGGAHCGGDELIGVGAGGGADHRGAAGGRGSAGAAASEQACGRGAQLHRRHRHMFLVLAIADSLLVWSWEETARN